MAKQALEGTRINAFGMDPKSLIIVGLDTKDGAEHPLCDPESNHLPVDEAMVQSILVDGVIEPVVVTKNDTGACLVDGRSRVRACRRANEILVAKGSDPILCPTIVRKGEDLDLMGVMFSANEIRRIDNPITRARRAQRYITAGRTEAGAAQKFGVTVQAVRMWTRVLGLPKPMVQAIEEGKIGITHGDRLARLEGAEQEAEFQRLLTSGGSVADMDRRGRTPKGEKGEKGEGSGDSKVGDEERLPRPPVSVLRKLVAAIEEGEASGIEPAAIQMLRWITGEIRPRNVKGLIQGLRSIGAIEEDEE